MIEAIKKSFSFSSIPKIVFGVGEINKLAGLCVGFGQKVLLVTGGKSFQESAYRTALEKQMKAAGLQWEYYPVNHEPSPEVIDQAIRLFKDKGIELIVAIGGGSVLDAGKAIAAMFCEAGSITEYLEGVGTKKPSGQRLPLIALPTTAGTGSEATKNAVITRQGDTGFKKSLRHNNYIPDVAVIDPQLSLSCSPLQTAASGMDAFTQLLEAYLSTKANPLTDTMALSGLRYIAQYLHRAVTHGQDIEARAGVAYAALLSGICLANAGLGLIHGFAQPLGSLFPIPHGMVCASLMYEVNRVTVESLMQNNPQSLILQKYAQVGRLFGADARQNNDEAIQIVLNRIAGYIDEFRIPRFAEYGVSENDIDRIVRLTDLKNHPVQLPGSAIADILKACI